MSEKKKEELPTIIQNYWLADTNGTIPGLEEGEPFREFLEQFLESKLNKRDSAGLLKMIILRFGYDAATSFELVRFFKKASEGNLNTEEFDLFLDEYMKVIRQIIFKDKVVIGIVMAILLFLIVGLALLTPTIFSSTHPTMKLASYINPLMVSAVSYMLYHMYTREINFLKKVNVKKIIQEMYVSLNKANKQENPFEDSTTGDQTLEEAIEEQARNFNLN